VPAENSAQVDLCRHWEIRRKCVDLYTNMENYKRIELLDQLPSSAAGGILVDNPLGGLRGLSWA
jgi:hypothetical protein